MSPRPPSPHDNLRLQLTYEPAETIKPHPRDARLYGRAERRRIAKSLAAFGPMPLIVTSDRVVLSGNVWLEAYKKAGIALLPVVVADHLTPAQAEAFMLAQVRLIERGQWDQKILGEIFRDLTLQDLDFDMEITGFEVPEIDLLIEGAGKEAEVPEPADEPAPEGPPVTRLGDVWRLRRHRLLCGDALEAESYRRVLGGGAAAIVFADPPYNTEIEDNVSGKGKVKHKNFIMGCGMDEAQFSAFLTRSFTLAAAHSAPGSLHYWCMDWRHFPEMAAAGRAAYDTLLNLCVWTKTNAGQGSFYRSQHELVFVFKNGKARHRNNIQLGRFGRYRSNVWAYPSAGAFSRGGEEGNLLALHPTVKPVALIADVLLDASVRGDTVLDPFAGSGSTIIAAEKVGRIAAAIELDPIYVDAAARRWRRWSGEEARLGDGRTFAEVEAQRAGEGGHD